MNHQPPLMKCGCAANAKVMPSGEPSCVIHGCVEVADDRPDLTGREARCSYNPLNEPGRRGGGRNGTTCRGATPSSYGLAFFQHRPDQEFDVYYCGCWGWD